MKKIIYLGLLMMTTMMISCQKEDLTIPKDVLKKTETIQGEGYTIDIYTKTGKLTDGYNKIYLKVKNEQNELMEDETIHWSIMMDMGTMQHGCPLSEMEKSSIDGFYEGYAIFQMAGEWEFSFRLFSDELILTKVIEIKQASSRRVNVFVGADQNKYVLAMLPIEKPIVGSNKMKALLFRMDGMMDFPVVNDYTVKIDPRMPGMENHSSPNNVDLQQQGGEIYEGVVNFSMTGLWRINLQLFNSNNELLKGEQVNEENESSSIFFEVEF